MNRIEQAGFVLIDGVLRPEAVASLYRRCESLDIEPLYLGTRWKDLHDLGPVLVRVQSPSSLIEETRKNAARQPDASLLCSHASLRVVADHLRRFIAPGDVLGGNGLLRFADPLVTRHWLDSYQGRHLDDILGPIDAWYVPCTSHSWEPPAPHPWSTFTRSTAPDESALPHVMLGQAQLDALQQASRWRFIEQLGQRLGQDHARHLATIDQRQLTRWLAERLDEAQAWGLVCERSLAIWIEYSLRWGEGFTLRADSPYQQWQARTPQAVSLAPERRIQKMASDCLYIETNKDMS